MGGPLWPSFSPSSYRAGTRRTSWPRLQTSSHSSDAASGSRWTDGEAGCWGSAAWEGDRTARVEEAEYSTVGGSKYACERMDLHALKRPTDFPLAARRLISPTELFRSAKVV